MLRLNRPAATFGIFIMRKRAAGVKHWHGVAKDSWFAHLAIEVPAEDGGTEWCEPVDAEDYKRLK